MLGRVYEYFLGQFASAEGKKGGEFYTPRCVVRLLVEMLEPYKGRVYDPCCGSGGMFVQSEKFVEEHGGSVGDISIYGQESNHTTWRLAKMNLAIRGIDANLGPEHADSFHDDLHPDLKADFILANPPFNISDWGGEHPRTTSAGNTAHRRPATPTTPGCSTSSTTWRPPAGRIRAGQWLDVVEPIRRRGNPQGHHRGRPRRLHGRPARPALLLHADSRLPLVPHPQ